MSIRSAQHKQDKGFVILFAVLVSAVILIIAAGIFRVTFKENLLISITSQSHRAFYAADAALSCALLQDAQGQFIPTGLPLACDGTTYPLSPTGASPTLYSFDIDFPSLDSCARIRVEKGVIDTSIPSGLKTRIVSRGFNECTSSGEPDVDNPFLVERVLRAEYPE